MKVAEIARARYRRTVGDEWDVEPEVVLSLLDPWKGIPMELESEHGWSVPSDDHDLLAEGGEVSESFDGELTATYTGRRLIDGTLVAVMALKGEVETALTGDRWTSSPRLHLELSETRAIEGEALWHLEGGHLHRLDVEVKMRQSLTLGETVPNQTGGVDYRETLTEELEGTQELSVSFEETESSP